MEMLREINLPPGVTGRLFRAPMPGRYDWDLRRAEREMDEQTIDLVVSLASMREIREISPRYARAIEDEALPWEMWDMPVPDGGIPADEEDFLDMARDIAEELRGGVHVLIHCNAGVGRTGMLAILVLVALGMSLPAAQQAVDAAGAGPESIPQETFVERMARVIRQDEER